MTRRNELRRIVSTAAEAAGAAANLLEQIVEDLPRGTAKKRRQALDGLLEALRGQQKLLDSTLDDDSELLMRMKLVATWAVCKVGGPLLLALGANVAHDHYTAHTYTIEQCVTAFDVATESRFATGMADLETAVIALDNLYEPSADHPYFAKIDELSVYLSKARGELQEDPSLARDPDWLQAAAALAAEIGELTVSYVKNGPVDVEAPEFKNVSQASRAVQELAADGSETIDAPRGLTP